MLVFCFVFLKTFEEGGFGHRKSMSMSLETHLLTITEQAIPTSDRNAAVLLATSEDSVDETRRISSLI